jgi:hypothetical protein
MKQLVTFKISDGGHEYQSYGIYDHKYSDKKIVKDFFGLERMQEDYDYKNSYWWYDDKLISIENRVDIDDDKIKIMKDYGVAYEHSI